MHRSFAWLIGSAIASTASVYAADGDAVVTMAVAIAAASYASDHCPSLVVEKDKIAVFLKANGVKSVTELPTSFRNGVFHAIDAFEKGGPEESCITILNNFNDLGAGGFIRKK